VFQLHGNNIITIIDITHGADEARCCTYICSSAHFFFIGSKFIPWIKNGISNFNSDY